MFVLCTLSALAVASHTQPPLALQFEAKIHAAQGFGHDGDGCVLAERQLAQAPVVSQVWFDAPGKRLAQENTELRPIDPRPNLTVIGRFDDRPPTEIDVDVIGGKLWCETEPLPPSFCANGSRTCPPKFGDFGSLNAFTSIRAKLESPRDRTHSALVSHHPLPSAATGVLGMYYYNTSLFHSGVDSEVWQWEWVNPTLIPVNGSVILMNVTRNFTYTVSTSRRADGTRPLLRFQWTQSIPLRPALPVHRDCFIFDYTTAYKAGPITSARFEGPAGVTCQNRSASLKVVANAGRDPRRIPRPTDHASIPQLETPPHIASAPHLLHGLALVANGPAKNALVTIDSATGAASVVGPPHAELFGPGDLVALAHGVLYFLGDTKRGATLVGLNLSTGIELCSTAVDVAEIQFVGIGQSLDYDAATDTLVLSGLCTSRNGSHAVYRSAARGGCGPFTHVGNFGVGNFAPMLHASALDAAGQRLFVTLAPSQHGSAVGTIDLVAGGAMTVVGEGSAPDLHDSLLCMHYDPGLARLIGVLMSADRTGLEIHALDPDSGTWEQAKAVTGVPKSWNALFGNSAIESAFDVANRALYFTAGKFDGATGDTVEVDLAMLDIDSAQVLSHPQMTPVGMPGCQDCLSALTL